MIVVLLFMALHLLLSAASQFYGICYSFFLTSLYSFYIGLLVTVLAAYLVA